MADNSRILVFDIESTNLKADFGFCLCVGYKWFGERRVHVPSVQEHPGDLDSGLMKHIWPILASADIWITYNGIRFDQRFLNSRMYKAGLPPLPPVAHVDLLYTMRSKFCLHSNRLASVQEFLDLEDAKTPIKMDIWVKAMQGSPTALRYIVEHCKQDVLVLEQAYTIMRAYMLRHPRVNGYGPCPTCGEDKLQKRGFSVVRPPLKNRKQRFQCTACGGWTTQAIPNETGSGKKARKGLSAASGSRPA